MAGWKSLIISKDNSKWTTERNSEKELVRGHRRNIPKDNDRPRVSLLVKHIFFFVKFGMRTFCLEDRGSILLQISLFPLRPS